MRKRPLFTAALLIVFLAALWLETGGANRAGPGQNSLGEPEAFQELVVKGQVYQKDETSVYLRSVSLSTSDSVHSASSADSVLHIICDTQQASQIPLGSMVTLEGSYAPFSHATNPGEFDSAEYYRTLGIGGRLRKATVLELEEGHWPVREGLYQLKCCLRNRLYSILPQKDASVMSALLLGDKKGLEDEVKDLYKRNGILHILSISSLHITIIGMSVYKLLRRMRMPVAGAAVAGSLVLLLYGGMTGFGVSSCRAIGMYLIRMLGQVTGRTYDMLTALGVMGAAMAAGNPYYLRNSGFLLSFGSVMGIGVLYPALLPEMPRKAEAPGKLKLSEEEKMQRAAKLCSWLPEPFRRMICRCIEALPALEKQSVCKSIFQSFFASLSITLSTLPIQLWFYYEIPIYALFLNLFVIPLMKPMMIAGILAMAVPGLGGLGIVNHVILAGYEALCGCFDDLPFRSWNPGCPQLWQIGIYYLLLGGAAVACSYGKRNLSMEKIRKDSLPKGTEKAHKQMLSKEMEKTQKQFLPKEMRRKASQIGFLLLAVLVLALRPIKQNSVTFLDVGQGDCILVRVASGQTYLFDCGSTSRSGVGRYVLLPCLKYYGIGEIDAVFLSHPDGDHVNGALELLALSGENGITVRQLVLPAIGEADREAALGELAEAARTAKQRSPVAVGYLAAGESWDCGGAVFRCLHPAEGYGAENPNEYSECVLAEFRERDGNGQKWTVLLTGDVEGEGEEALVAELKKRQINGLTVLKTAHHGSRNSTSEALLEQITPRLAVISCGRNNRYGHPHKELLERLEASGAYILQTARSGAITVTFESGNLRIKVWAGESGGK